MSRRPARQPSYVADSEVKTRSVAPHSQPTRAAVVSSADLAELAHFSGSENAPTRMFRPSYIDPSEIEEQPTRSPQEYAALEEEVAEIPTRVGLRSYIAPCEVRTQQDRESVTSFLATVAAEHLDEDQAREEESYDRRESVTGYAVIARPSYVAIEELVSSEIEELPSAEVAIDRDHDRSYSAALNRSPRISYVAPEEKSAALDIDALKAYLFDDQPAAAQAAAPLDTNAFASAKPRSPSRPEIAARASRVEISEIIPPRPPTTSRPSFSPPPDSSRRRMPSRPSKNELSTLAEAPTEAVPATMAMPLPAAPISPAAVIAPTARSSQPVFDRTSRMDASALGPRLAEMQKVMAMRQQALSMHGSDATREHDVAPAAVQAPARQPSQPHFPPYMNAIANSSAPPAQDSWRESPWSVSTASDTNRSYQNGFAIPPMPIRRQAETTSFKLTVTSLACVLTGLVALTVVVLAVMFVRADNGSGKAASMTSGFENSRSAAGFNVSPINDAPPPAAQAVATPAQAVATPAPVPSTITIGDPPVEPSTTTTTTNAKPIEAKPVVEAKPAVIEAKPVEMKSDPKPVVAAAPKPEAKPVVKVSAPVAPAAAPAPKPEAKPSRAAMTKQQKSVEDQLEALREEQLRR